MPTIEEKLEEALNLAPNEETKKSTALVHAKEAKQELVDSNKLMSTDKVKEDLDFVRVKMRDAIEQGANAMTELLELAKTSQGFEHYTAFASLMKSLNETNRNLIELHKGAVEIEPTVAPENDGQQIDTNVIIGTQQAVMEMIRQELGVSRGLEAAAKTIVLKVDEPGLQK